MAHEHRRWASCLQWGNLRYANNAGMTLLLRASQLADGNAVRPGQDMRGTCTTAGATCDSQLPARAAGSASRPRHSRNAGQRVGVEGWGLIAAHGLRCDHGVGACLSLHLLLQG